MTDAVMSQAQYARHRGCSRQAVSVAVKAGRIRLEANGKLDPAVADAMWAANTKTSMQRAPASSPSPTSGIASTRGQREQVKLELERLKLHREQGVMMPRAEAEAAVDRCAGAIQAWCKALPGRVAQRIAAATGLETSAVRRIVASEIPTLQSELADALEGLTPKGTTNEA